MIERIAERVAKQYGVTVEEMRGPSRKARIAEARHRAMFETRLSTQLSVTEIGEYFNRDHTSVVYAIKKMYGYVRIYAD